MKYLLIMLSVLFSGCGSHGKNILLATGKVPPMFFHFSSKTSMDRYLLDTKKYSILMPQTKAYDFTNGRRWEGGTSRDGNSISIFGMAGHINISTNYEARKYGESDRAIEDGTKKFRPQRTQPDGDIININTHIEHYGKENYPCVISESIDRFSRYVIGYRCYKFNPVRTKSTYVLVSLTYSQPASPTLAKQYTYQDLKRRAKRMLDSLYIKNGW